jgi:hypothetical protein
MAMDSRDDPKLPWWRVRMVWLVIAGPLLVVLAGVVTTVLAVREADTVVRDASRTTAAAQAPAMQARNHAAARQR